MAAPVNIEGALVSYLGAALGVPVSTRVPSARPARFVRVTRAGGQRVNLAESDLLVIVECWASDANGVNGEAAAWALARDAWAALDAADGTQIAPGVWVMDTGIAEPVNYPDVQTGTPRYQFTYTPTVILEETS